MTWTNDKPTEPGAYWIRGNGLHMPALVHVRPDEERQGPLRCNLHQVTTEFDMAYSYTIEQLSPEFEWCGPLLQPDALTPRKERCARRVEDIKLQAERYEALAQAHQQLTEAVAPALVRLVAIEQNAAQSEKWEQLLQAVQK